MRGISRQDFFAILVTKDSGSYLQKCRNTNKNHIL